MPSVVTERFIKCHDTLREEKRVRSSRQFALSLEYLPQSLSEILKGRRDVTIELIRKAVATYRINPVFLYTGEGSMFMSDEDHKNFRVLTIVTDSQEDERIVHVPVPAQAGYAGEMMDSTFVEELPTFTLPDYKYKVGTHRSFDVAGDSMEPTLYEGDKVVCSYVEPSLWEAALKDNYVYVIVTRGDVVVKRIVNQIRGEKVLKLISDNEFYQPFELNVGEIREIWYVKAKISPFLPSPQKQESQLIDEVKELRNAFRNQLDEMQQLKEELKSLLHNGK